MDFEIIEDLSLVNQILAGNATATEKFFSRYADPLYAFIYHHLDGTHTDMEDIWQETLIAAINAMPTFQGKSRLFSWICSIARHKIIDHLRRQGSNSSVVFSDLPKNWGSKLLSSESLPKEVVSHRATRICVVEALALLPDDYRTALVSRYADKLSVSDIAQKIGRSYKATESLLSRARTAFKEKIVQLEEKSK